jgi:hypothetical protein
LEQNPQFILENAVNGIKGLKGRNNPIVILMHVTKGTASVLPQIIENIDT